MRHRMENLPLHSFLLFSLSEEGVGGTSFTIKNANTSHYIIVWKYRFKIFVWGFLGSKPNKLLEQESKDTLSSTKLEHVEDTKESADQNHTEDVTESAAGMAVTRFISMFLETENYVFQSMGDGTGGWRYGWQ